jgi:hypothetical protein
MKENEREELKKLEAKSDALTMIMDMMAEMTEDPRMVMTARHNKSTIKIRDIALDDNTTDEQFEKITQLIEQFDKLIDDVLKEE